MSGFIAPSISPFVRVDSTHCAFVLDEQKSQLDPKSGREERGINAHSCPCPNQPTYCPNPGGWCPCPNTPNY